MARIVEGTKRAAMDPLKHSAPLGGVMAMLGIARCMPLLHGAQGCSAFAKALLTRHFREPIPLQTTALTEVASVLGATDNLHAAVRTIADKHNPDVIGVLTTGITEISGEDMAGALAQLGEAVQGPPDGPLVISANTPDFRGGLARGWAAALRSIVEVQLPPGYGRDGAARDGAARDGAGLGAATRDGAARQTLALLAGVGLTAGDIDELVELTAAFGLRTITVPDLSRSMDGHLGPGWTPLTTGGTTLDELAMLPHATTVLSVGDSAKPAAESLLARTGGAAIGLRYGHLGGMAATDALVGALMDRTGVRPGPALRRWRSRLSDTLLDSHFVLGGTRVAIAAEAETLAPVAAILAEAGAKIVTAVAPTSAPVLEQVPCEEVVIGDLFDCEERAAAAGAELLIGSSHARATADRIGAAHLVMGFPVYDRLGAQLRGTAGYRSSLNLLIDTANLLLDHRLSPSREELPC